MRIDAGRLRAFLDCMHLEADQRDKHSAQIREIVKAAKDAGYDPKAVRKVFVRERMDDAERSKQDDLLESYEGALGPKGAALRAIEQGATLDEAAAATGLGRATVARARAVSRKASNDTAEVSRESGNDTPPHDPDTGEVHDAPADRGRDTAGLPKGAPVGEVLVADEGRAAHATQLRAQIPTSTDPGRLEREAAALESVIGKDDADTGTHSGGGAQDIFAESAKNESCGEPAAALGAKAPLPAADLPTAPLRPHDTHRGGSSTGRTSPFQGEDAGSSPVPRSNNTALDTRGEARPSLEDSESTWFSTLQRSRQEGRV